MAFNVGVPLRQHDDGATARAFDIICGAHIAARRYGEIARVDSIVLRVRRAHMARKRQPFAIKREISHCRRAKEMIALTDGALIQRKEEVARRTAIAVRSPLRIAVKMVAQIIESPFERDRHPIDISLRELALPAMNHVTQHNGSLCRTREKALL